MHSEHKKHNINTYCGSQHNLSECDEIHEKEINENKRENYNGTSPTTSVRKIFIMLTFNIAFV